MKKRCSWCGEDPLLIHYHDTEWGIPVHEDHTLFEFLVLESMQAGLSWALILKRRPFFREAFEGFDPEKVARFTPKKIEELLLNEKLIRNRKKLESAVHNARCFLKVQEEERGFNRYLWNFVEGRPVVGNWQKADQVPCLTPLSDRMAKEWKTKGFQFVGTKICYSFLQAAGIVNDHLIDCDYKK